MSRFFVDNETWVKAQWQNSNLGDVRRNMRALKLAISILNKPDASLPEFIIHRSYKRNGFAQRTHWLKFLQNYVAL